MARQVKHSDLRGTGFPSCSLQPIGGEIYCYVFENKNTGLKRNLFWSITVNFAPIEYGGEPWDCAMTCEWIVLPIRSWKELDGQQLEVDYGERGIESSFYMSCHHPGKHTRLRLSREAGNVFRVVMDMRVEFGGWLGGDEESAMPIHAEILVPFTRLIVSPEDFFPKPDTAPESEAVAAQFVDLKDFQSPERDNHNFSFCPKY